MFKKIIQKLSIFVMAFIFAFSGVASSSLLAIADDNEAVAGPDAVEYLTGNDLSDEEIEDAEDLVESTFGPYVTQTVGGRLQMSTTPIETQLGDAIYDENLDVNVLTGNQAFEVAAVKMIRTNISIMNALYDEQLGYIDNNYEFIFTESDNYVAQWSAWDFKIKWNKLNVKFDRDFAITFSGLFLVANLVVQATSLYRTLNEISNNPGVISSVISDACDDIQISLLNQIAALQNNSSLTYAVNTVTTALQILSAGNVAYKVFEVIFGVLMPSIEDSLVVLYNSIKYSVGMSLQLCWIPTWGVKWGFQIKPL